MFGQMNPKRIKYFSDAYNIKAEKDIELRNFTAYIQGMYIYEAVASCLTKHKYPKEPYDLNIGDNNEVSVESQVDEFFRNLEIMQTNFNNSKGNSVS